MSFLRRTVCKKTAFSEEIDYRTDRNVTDEELIAMIGYAKELGLTLP